jgi:type II secretory pathway predicted ATPase ExeA
MHIVDREVFSQLNMKFNPFSSAIDEQGYYHTGVTKSIIAEFIHGISSRKGFLILIGDVGVGKTALLLQLMPYLHQRKVKTAFIFNSMLSYKDLLMAICHDYGLNVPDSIRLSKLLKILHKFFLHQTQQGNNCTIIIDEAHNLNNKALECLRMLSNLETGGQKLVQILLAGQTELQGKLDNPSLRQLRSRISIHHTLPPLHRKDIDGYLAFKLACSGTQIRPTRQAVKHIWKGTRGNIRLINLAMERALYSLIAQQKWSIDSSTVSKALQDIAHFQNEVAIRLKHHRRKRFALAAVPGSALIVSMLILYFGKGIFLIASPLPDPQSCVPKQRMEQVRSEDERPQTGKAPAAGASNKGQKIEPEGGCSAQMPAESVSALWHVVQVGSHKTRETALNQIQSLAQAGFEACMVPVWDKQGSQWYVVEIGLAQRKASALKIGTRFTEQYGADFEVLSLGQQHVRSNLECPQ